MSNDDVVSILNDLIETSKDGEKGFRVCAEDVKDSNLKSTFIQHAEECAQAAAELQGMVRDRGGDPEEHASMAGELHRRWVDLKSLVTGKDDKAILNECERGEDMAKKSYKKALDKELPPEVRSVVERQYQVVLRNHDQVKALRDAARAQK